MTSLATFLDAVRRRLDRGVASRIGARCLLAASAASFVWAVARVAVSAGQIVVQVV